VSPFRFRGLWQWNPVSCLSPRSYDEKHMLAHSDWFFDRALMSRYFDALNGAGVNTWVLANTHPFPFMVDLSAYPDAVVLSASELRRYQSHYRWLFDTARTKGILPFVLFHTCYVPDAFGEKRQIRPAHSYAPSPLAVEYTRHCVRQLCETFPELAGVNAEASENVAADLRSGFARDAIVAGIHDSSRRPILFFRGWISDPAGMKEKVLDAYEGECFFTVKYTWEFLVHPKPDPEFRRWISVCGAERVLPEFWISQYQPFGCHDTGLAAGIRENLVAMGCPGFTSHPMDLYGAPIVQGRQRKVFQIERDQDWFATLSGEWSGGDQERARAFGLPAAPLRKSSRAACVPFQRISYYLTGNKQNFLQPQWLAAITGSPERKAGLHTLTQWAMLPQQTKNAFGRWMEQIDGVKIVYPGEEGVGYGLEQLLSEMDALDAEWEDPPQDAPRSPDVYAAWRDDVAGLRAMARAWAWRARAVLAHFAGRRADALDALRRSLRVVKQVPSLVGSDGPYRQLVGRHVVMLTWSGLASALEAEIEDYAAGREQTHYFHGDARHYDLRGKDFAAPKG